MKEQNNVRCPNCGVSDVTYNIEKKKLVCNYCHTEFEPESVEGLEIESKDLTHDRRSSGASDISESTSNTITLKCDGCGAEVVINTEESANARCHWCRSILSLNSKIENGITPDVILPFSLTKEEAKKKIEDFVSNRKFYANKQFREEFTTDNIIGVYFPYMLVDAKCHGLFKGQGQHLIRRYTVGSGDDEETRYDYDLYDVAREFDIAIDDLSIESNYEIMDKNNNLKTNNVLNSIMPFDTMNCVKFKSNYLIGYSSEKRDLDIENVKNKVNLQLLDVTKSALNKTLNFYDRGVRWDLQDLDVQGRQWQTAYLPVWLYSYQDKDKVLHYIAVNGRTGETMGSVPISETKLLLTSILIGLAILLFGVLLSFPFIAFAFPVYIASVVVPIIFYSVQSNKYRNKNARHTYEKETKHEFINLDRSEMKIKSVHGSSSSYMHDANNENYKGDKIGINKQ
jgi:ribosomal protein S27E